MLEYTGERYLPTESGLIKYEHLHRYALAAPLVAGHTVLDLAAGEGYGAALLAAHARAVTGVDIDPQAVAHAQAKYAGRANLTFLTGSCAAIPLPNAAVEVVTSFETIEHHAQHEEMLAEFKRVLRPGGLLIISSPNKLVYSDQANYQNPYHVKELYQDEFTALLGRHFRHTRLYGQRLAVGSFIYDMDSAAPELAVHTGDDAEVRQQFQPLHDPRYFLALCSDDAERTRAAAQSLFLQSAGDVLRELTEAASRSFARQYQIDCLTTEKQALEQELRQTAAVRDDALRRLDEIVHSRAWELMQLLWRWKSRLAGKHTERGA